MAVTVIKGVRIFQTMDPVQVIEDADVVIQDSVIKAVGSGAAYGVSADTVIDGRGKTLIPGNVCPEMYALIIITIQV